MYNYLYRITNLINNKIYIGVHKTNDLDDGYMGSGSVIKSAIKKYGIAHFKKDILETFDTYEAALLKEKEIVTDEFLLRDDVYNLRRGGTGGFDYINKNIVVDRKSISEDLWKDPEYREKQKSINRDSFRLKGKTAFSGKTHSDATKLRQSAAKKGKRIGEQSSQYGSMWITNGLVNKKIKKDDIIPAGWYKGRV